MTTDQQQEKKDTERAVTKWEEAGIPAETAGMARAMVQSGYFPGVTNVAQAIVKIQLGQSLGVTPVEAMQYLHVFTTDGRTNIQLGYPLIGALIQRSGKYHFDPRVREDDVCEIDFYRIGPAGEMRKLGTSRFTMEQARNAGLAAKAVWEKWPERMLFARALTHGARTFCPEVLGGAQASAEEPYFEGEARVIGEEPVTEPVTIDEPPEGLPDPWARFWAKAHDLGYDGPGVHAFFGVGPGDGELKRYADDRAHAQGELLAMIVGTMQEELQEYVAEANRAAVEEAEAAGPAAEADAPPKQATLTGAVEPHP